MSKNINDFDENIEDKLPSQEETLMNESDLLSGLLEASKFKEDESFKRKIQVKRSGKVLFEFFIRPLTEEEINDCRKKVTKRKPDPRGKQFGMIDIETDHIKLRSWKILTSTVNNGKESIWSNKILKDTLEVFQDVDVIDCVLMAGEKDRICDIIDEISGYGTDEVTLEETAKN